MKTILSVLVKIANKLDRLGEYELSSDLDEIIREAASDRAKLEADLQEIEKRLKDPNTPPERLVEINEAKKNIESELAGLQDDAEAEPEPSGNVTIGVNDFVTRQTATSKFSYYNGSFADVVYLAKQNFASAKPGYQEGVLEIPVPPAHFFSSVVELQPGDNVVGKFESRREGEQPYMQMSLPEGKGEKLPAKSVNIIVYSRELLERDNEKTTGADWDIISINASPWDAGTGEAEPINPQALMRNYFGESGGSPMEGVSAEEFVQMLKKSRDYWSNKVMM